jgi:hypothetical protein
MTAQVPDLASVVARLEKVERQNRQLKMVGGMVLALAVAGMVMGQALPSARVVEAEGFVLKDAAGKVRAELSVDGEGAKLLLGSENGKSRAMLNVDKDGPALTLFDENAKLRAWLAVFKDGPRLALRDESEKVRVGLSVDGDRPRLRLYDEKSKTRAVLGPTELETTGTGEQRPESSLVLFDRDGKVLWQTP